jgi:Protein of unknown function (DUF2628)
MIHVHATLVILGVLAVLAVAYHYYNVFPAARVAVIDDTRETEPRHHGPSSPTSGSAPMPPASGERNRRPNGVPQADHSNRCQTQGLAASGLPSRSVRLNDDLSRREKPMEDNPYRAPQASLAEVSELTEAEARAFVGRNAKYYLANWAPALPGQGRASGFNRSAFWFGVLWLPYRKMYRVTLIFFAIIVLETALEEFLVAVGIGNKGMIKALGGPVGLITGIVCGTYGNAWYLAHAKRRIAGVRALGLEGDAYFEAVARRGGTSLLTSFGFCFFLLVAAMTLLGVVHELFVPMGR